MYEFKLPDVGEGLHEATIARWLVQAGDVVKQDEPMVEIERDKAVVEIPSPVAGSVAQLCVAEGELVTVGTVIVVLEPLAKVAKSKSRSREKKTTEAVTTLLQRFLYACPRGPKSYTVISFVFTFTLYLIRLPCLPLLNA